MPLKSSRACNGSVQISRMVNMRNAIASIFAPPYPAPLPPPLITVYPYPCPLPIRPASPQSEF